jgi:hypothetical protein
VNFKARGYRNGASHAQNNHPDFAHQIPQVRLGGQFTIDHYINPDAQLTYDWLKLIVMKECPLSWTDDPYIRSIVKFKPICSKTFKLRMDKVVREIERVNIDMIKDQPVGLMYDGWSGPQSTHYVGIFASFPGHQIMLGFSPLPDESSQTANAHIEYFDAVMTTYAIDVENVRFFVADNTETNKAIARRTRTYLFST